MCRRLSCLSPCLSEVKTQGEDKPYPMKNPGGKAGGSYAYYKRYGRNEVLRYYSLSCYKRERRLVMCHRIIEEIPFALSHDKTKGMVKIYCIN